MSEPEIERISVVSNPEILGGEPCIQGTRIPVQTILADLEGGDRFDQIFGSYPTLPNGGIEAAIRWAEANDIAWRPRDFGPSPVRKLRDIDPAVIDAMLRFRISLEKAYGESFRELHLFGSRARGSAGKHSDVDLVVVLDRIPGSPRDEKMRLADLGYDVLIATGLVIHAFTVTSHEWTDETAQRSSELLRSMKRDAFPLTDLLTADIVGRMRQPRIVGETAKIDEATARRIEVSALES